jgi:tRNA threonylcarbamoyladenosine biosynthesis protein TsaE
MTGSNPSETLTIEEKDLDLVATKVLDILTKHKLNTLALIGSLGAGKTTITQRIAKKLQILRTIQSPTFILMNDYDVPASSNSDFTKLFHIDAYRIDDINEVAILDLVEIRSIKENLIIIEWADKVQSKLTGQYLEVTISDDPKGREFKFEIKK